MLNVDNVVRLRDFIAELPAHQFDMTVWAVSHDCGTVGCIGGWGCQLFSTDADGIEKVLGLTEEEANALFCPPDYSHPGRYTQAMAVETLTRLAETGEVSWS